MSDPSGKYLRPLRRAIDSVLSAVLMRGKVAAWSYRRGWHGKLGVEHYAMRLHAQQRLAAPLRIAFVSDLHAGPTTHSGLFDELRDQLLLLRPDVLLLGGDYVSFDARHVEQLRDVLTAFAPALGMYAVIGNHDIRTERAVIEATLRALGVHVLVNQNIALPAPFEMISVCGIDDPWVGQADAVGAFAGAGPVKLFLTHSPDGLTYLGDQVFDLAFAGHTHGGQVAHRSGAPVLTPSGRMSRQYCYGEFSVPGNGSLFVSRGFGCTLLPLRINANPELVMCTVQ